MEMHGKLVALLIVALLSVTARAESNCGTLDERLLHDRDVTTEPAEYTWLGLLKEVKGNNTENTRCNVVIVGKLHVLTTASCVRRFENPPQNLAVLVGVWNESHTPDSEFECNSKGFCVPGPVLHRVADIKVNPMEDRDTGDNDLAILRLTEPIEWSPYIQPVCMQPDSEPLSLTNRNLPFVGFTHANYLKGKGIGLVVSRQHCNKLTSSKKPPPENQFCAYPPKTTRFYEASAMMGLNVEEDIPRSFYLLAILSKVVNNGQTTTLLFQDIRPWRTWIRENTQSA